MIPFPISLLHRNRNPVCSSLDHAEFFSCFAGLERAAILSRGAYRQRPYSLRNYLYNLYVNAIKRDIDIILSNRYLPQDNIDFLAEFYTCAFLYYSSADATRPASSTLPPTPARSPTSSQLS